MLLLAEAGDLAADRHVVRGVGENERRLVPPEPPGMGGGSRGVPAEQPVLAELPRSLIVGAEATGIMTPRIVARASGW